MGVVMVMDWPGVSRDQYEAVRGIAKWDTDHPDGAKLHVAGFDDTGLHVTDVWESEEQFNRFMEQRLAAGIQEVGLEGQPNVRFLPVGGVFIPALGYAQQESI